MAQGRPTWTGRVGTGVWLVALVVCFGAVGLIWALPGVRRRAQRKAARCAVCRRHRTWSRVFVGGLVVLQAAGVATTAYAAAAPPLVCHARVYPDGRVEPEPLLRGVSPPRAWGVVRDVVNAPTSGLALLGGRAAGMRACGGPPLTVTFWMPPRTSRGGSTVGAVFVAWMPVGLEGSSLLAGARGFGVTAEGHGLAPEGPYVRYGPNISATRANEKQLARHESRHTDQWAVLTLLGGPLAFPAAYYADSALFPLSRNHFERAAGLADGGYPVPPDNGPAPLPGAVAVIGVALLLVLRRRIRWLSRVVVAGRAGGTVHLPGRCPLHTTGWFRSRGATAVDAGQENRA